MARDHPADDSAPGMGPALRRLLGDSMVYGIGRVAGYLVGLILLPLYTHYLSVEDYGLLENLFVLAMFLGTVTPLGIPDAAERLSFLAGDARDRRETSGTAILGVALLALVAIPPLLLAAGLVAGGLFDAPRAAAPIRLAAVTLLPAGALSVAFAILKARFFRWRFGLCSVMQVVFLGGLNLWFVAGAGMGLTGVFLGTGIASALAAALALFLVRREVALRLSLSKLRALLGYGAPLVPAFLALWALHYADRWLLYRMAGPAEAGLYAAGARIAGVVLFLNFAFSTAFRPLAFDIEKRPEAARVYARSLTIHAALAGGLAVLLTAVARPALSLLAPEIYREGARAVPWLAAGFALAGAVPALRIGLFLAKATRDVLVIDVAAALANVALNVLLIPRFGITGAAAATTAAFALMAVLSFFAGRRRVPIPVEWGRIGAIVAATAAGLLLVSG